MEILALSLEFIWHKERDIFKGMSEENIIVSVAVW